MVYISIVYVIMLQLSLFNYPQVKEDKACNQTVTADGTIEFGPGFGPFEEDCRIYKWHVPVDGYDLNVTINHLDLDETAGNYLIISPGPSLVQDEASVVITGKIQTTKLIRVIGHNEMTVLLVMQKNITNETWEGNSFKLSYKAYGPVTEKPTTTTPKPTPNTTEDIDITVHISGMKTNEFLSKKLELFKGAVAKMANSYCNDTSNKITLLSDTQADNVALSLITACPVTWPNWETCTEICMTVAVPIGGNGYELTQKNLIKMWDKHARDELANVSLEVYKVPDNAEDTLNHWLYISVGVAAIFAVLMIALWQFNFFNTNKKGVPIPPDPFKISDASNKSWVSNNSYQEVPPMTDLLFEDTDIKPTAYQEPAASANTFSSPLERPTSLDQYGAAFLFQNRVPNTGYNNPSFDASSEQHHPSNADYADDFSSDEDSRANTSKDNKSNQDHLHKAPKQVTYQDNNNESAF